MKRLFDLIISFLGLIILSPLLIIVLLLVYLQDFRNPFYIADRVGINERKFRMFKIRSMVVNADKTGVDSTSSNDRRITAIGRFVRKFKIDEVSQLINVFIGDMSLVGPRPNVKRETDLYTREEKQLLSVKPGITDFSSIVFSDEGDILKDSTDPDLDYNQLIRPWKSRLGLFYIKKRTLGIDLKLIYYTVLTVISRDKVLLKISSLLKNLGADDEMLKVASRKDKLKPTPPPGSNEVVQTR